MGGSQGGSQAAAGKVIPGHTEDCFIPLADLPIREHTAKIHSDLSP